MLKKTQRIRAADVDAARSSGKSLRGDHLTARVSRIEGESRAGVIISKRVARKAVDRNALKRKVRAALAPILDEHPSGLRLIVYPTTAARTKNVAALTQELRSLL